MSANHDESYEIRKKRFDELNEAYAHYAQAGKPVIKICDELTGTQILPLCQED